MGTAVINLPEDRRYEGVNQGLATIVAETKRKKLEKAYSKAFTTISVSPSYESAVKSLSDLDPELLSNEKAVGSLNDYINKRFPETETLNVIDANRKQTTVTHRKGSPPSDEDLARQGLTRASSAGVGTFFTLDEQTGDIQIQSKATREEVEKNAGGRLVLSEEDVPSGTSLLNAFANKTQSEAQKKAAEAAAGRDQKATEFEQTVEATAQRLGLDDNDPTQHNQAVNVVKGSEPARKVYTNLLTKQVGDQIILTAPDIAGAVANGGEFIEPILADGGSPDSAAKGAYAAFSYTVLSDTKARAMFDPSTKTKLARDFTDITGFVAGDPYLQNAVTEADKQLENGQSGSIDVIGKDGKVLGSVTVAKIGGRTIPVSGVRAK